MSNDFGAKSVTADFGAININDSSGFTLTNGNLHIVQSYANLTGQATISGGKGCNALAGTVACGGAVVMSNLNGVVAHHAFHALPVDVIGTPSASVHAGGAIVRQ